MLANTLRDEQPTHLAVAFDVSRKTWRFDEYPEYKATRSATPDEFRSQVELIGELLDAMRVRRFAVDGYEADDVIATLATPGGGGRLRGADRHRRPGRLPAASATQSPCSTRPRVSPS